MKPHKLSLILMASLLLAVNVTAQEIVKKVRPFSRIVASPHINVILEEGESESVKLVYHNISEDRINVDVRGKTLRLYLDDARITDKLEGRGRHSKRDVYNDVSITAYITYRTLQHLEVRGAQEVTCHSPIRSDKKFKIKAYGQNEINLVSLRTDFLKTVLYGENRLKIKGGRADYQKYKLYGENRIDASKMKSYSASAMSFGESDVRINSQDEVRVTAFGETRVSFSGDANLSRGLILGKTDINRVN